MNLEILTTVSIIWAVAAVTPGPNFFITVHTSVGKTRRLSFFTVSGIVAGTSLWAAAAYLGVSIIFKAVPVLYYSLKILGGMYLIYTGLSLLVRNSGSRNLQPDKKTPSAFASFKLGLFTNLLNPKTAAFMTSLFAATIPADIDIRMGILCVVLICSISALWYLLVATIFSSRWAKRAHTGSQRIMERIAGLIFISFGFKLAFSK